MTLTVEEVMERVEFDPNGGCWLWSGSTTSDYGIISRGHKRYLVHRFMLAQKIGREIPDGMWACHHCDVRSCVNPDHLYVGSPADNVWDTHIRKRTPRLGHKSFTEFYVSRADYIAEKGHWSELYRRQAADKHDAIFKLLALTHKDRKLIRDAAGNEDLVCFMKRAILDQAKKGNR